MVADLNSVPAIVLKFTPADSALVSGPKIPVRLAPEMQRTRENGRERDRRGERRMEGGKERREEGETIGNGNGYPAKRRNLIFMADKF